MEHPLKQFTNCPKCGSSHFNIHNFKSKKCEACQFIYYFNPSAATVAVILNNKNEILVCRRANNPAKGTLDLPGGFVDMYETGEQAIAREVKEETGLVVVESAYLFSFPNLYVYSGFEVQTLDLFYRCSVEQTNVLVAEDDVSEAFFIPLENLNIEEFGLRSIKRALKYLLDNKMLLDINKTNK